jgi:hypothetical protein
VVKLPFFVPAVLVVVDVVVCFWIREMQLLWLRVRSTRKGRFTYLIWSYADYIAYKNCWLKVLMRYEANVYHIWHAAPPKRDKRTCSARIRYKLSIASLMQPRQAQGTPIADGTTDDGESVGGQKKRAQ